MFIMVKRIDWTLQQNGSTYWNLNLDPCNSQVVHDLTQSKVSSTLPFKSQVYMVYSGGKGHLAQ